jgi:MFS family permease
MTVRPLRLSGPAAPPAIAQAGTRPAGRPGAVRAAAPHPAWALTALLGAMFLGNVDVAIANIAGPSIRASLHASGGELELIVSGYTLAYAVLLVTSARLGEARGYRPMFLAGLGGFTAASLACGLAPVRWCSSSPGWWRAPPRR